MERTRVSRISLLGNATEYCGTVSADGQSMIEADKVIVEGGTYHHASFGIQEIHYHGNDVESVRTDHDSTSLKRNVSEALRRMTLHSTKVTQPTSAIVCLPKMKLLDMTSDRAKPPSKERGESAVFFGQDIKDVLMKDFHEDVNGNPCRHVMILGEAGAGKSTLSRMYASAVMNRQFELLKDIELVVFVNAFDLSNDSPCSVFELFFTHQMSGDLETELTRVQQQAGLHWIRNNSNKMLICIDGLDQFRATIGGKRYAKTSFEAMANADTILANIMSGNIWPKAKILTTARWSVYWALMAKQRPDKVIGLKGFDDTNMEKAALSIIPNSSENMLKFIRHSAPKLLALCRNPMFLSYTSKVFETNADDLPDSISSLMAAVFSDFVHCCQHLELESITKLAFRGMEENRFEFSNNYLKKIGVDPQNMDGFITNGALIQPGQNEAKPHDKKYAFSHQSMQEFCAVMHITSLDKALVEDLVFNKLNTMEMELMRKLFYGIILNENATKRIRGYIEDKNCSIEECRDILLRKLREMLLDGVIYDIRLVTLIAECGRTVLNAVNIHRIHIEDFNLLRNDQHTLISLIRRCSRLRKVFIQQLWLDPHLVENVSRCYSHLDEFKAGYEVTDSISIVHFNSVMNIFDNTKIVRVNLRCSDDVKCLFLSRWMERPEIAFEYLGLLNVFNPDIVHKIFEFLSKFSLHFLRLNLNCQISKDDLAWTQTGVKWMVDNFIMEDKHLTEDKLHVYYGIFKATKSKNFNICRCDLNTKKLELISKTCQESGAKFEELRIVDNLLAPDGYRKIPMLMHAADSQDLSLELCELTDEKILQLQRGFQKHKTTLKRLSIYDGYSAPDMFNELPQLLKQSSCNRISFIGCNLSVEKLKAFRSSCKDTHCRHIDISDMTMTADAYCEISLIAKDLRCQILGLFDCDLTEAKLSVLTENYRVSECRLEILIVSDNSLPPRGYRGLAMLIAKSNRPDLSLVECHISSENLNAFYQQCRDIQLTIYCIVIRNKGYEPSDDVISVVGAIIRNTVTYLYICDWIISDQHKEKMRQAVKLSNKPCYVFVDMRCISGDVRAAEGSVL